uniref:Uncharacterized protein n=1 Tax=Sphaeramia orbicularis TaxID=375764 RepID=A0A672YSF3_9TELE
LKSWQCILMLGVNKQHTHSWTCVLIQEPAKMLLDAGEQIPCDLMAKIVKFLLLQIKTNDQQRREAEKLALGCRIFEGVAHLVYDCLDWRRQHQHYLDNIKLINVPKVIVPDIQPVVLTPPPMSPRSKKRTPRGEKAQLPPLSTDVDMRYYNNLLDLVSPESCSVPLILHSMLEQVCMCMLKISPSRGKIQNVVSWPEVERLFHHSVFESMPLTTLHQKGVLLNATGSLQTPPIIPWDNPLSYAKQQFSILSRKGLLFNLIQWLHHLTHI